VKGSNNKEEKSSRTKEAGIPIEKLWANKVRE
jgi:hypothetical protein